MSLFAVRLQQISKVAFSFAESQGVEVELFKPRELHKVFGVQGKMSLRRGAIPFSFSDFSVKGKLLFTLLKLLEYVFTTPMDVAFCLY